MTELLEALYRGRQDRVDELLAAGPALTVHEAAALGNTERLRELLDDDPARADEFGDDGFHPLGLACFFGHVDAGECRRTVHAAIDGGINFFDVAPYYGLTRAETVLGGCPTRRQISIRPKRASGR